MHALDKTENPASADKRVQLLLALSVEEATCIWQNRRETEQGRLRSRYSCDIVNGLEGRGFSFTYSQNVVTAYRSQTLSGTACSPIRFERLHFVP